MSFASLYVVSIVVVICSQEVNCGKNDFVVVVKPLAGTFVELSSTDISKTIGKRQLDIQKQAPPLKFFNNKEGNVFQPINDVI